MRSILLTAILISTSLSISYAQKCEVKADPFTGEKTVEFMNNQRSIAYTYKGGETTEMLMTFIFSGEQNAKFAQGSEVLIKLKNDEIISLKSKNEPLPETEVSASSSSVSVTTKYKFLFDLSHDEIRKLASDKIALIRRPAIDGGIEDIEIKGLGKIYAKKITEGAECISENLMD